MKRKSKISIWSEYLAVRAAVCVFRALPLGWTPAVGRFLGVIGFLLLRRHRVRAVQHLLHAGVVDSEKSARTMARESFTHLGRTAVEFFKIDQALEKLGADACLVEPPEKRYLDIVESGCIAVGVHYGNWEITRRLHPGLTTPTHVIVRPLDNPKIDRLVRHYRACAGTRLVEKNGGLRPALRALRNGETVLLLADQRAARAQGVMTTFFGQPAMSHPAPALLHLRTGAPILLVATKRLPGAFKYEIVLRGPITWKRCGDTAKDVQGLTQLYTSEIERLIRDDPTQWTWAHRRFNNINRDRRRRRRRRGRVEESAVGG